MRKTYYGIYLIPAIGWYNWILTITRDLIGATLFETWQEAKDASIKRFGDDAKFVVVKEVYKETFYMVQYSDGSYLCPPCTTDNKNRKYAVKFDENNKREARSNCYGFNGILRSAEFTYSDNEPLLNVIR